MTHTRWLKNRANIGNDISTTIKEMVAEPGKTCISIIVPTHRFGQHKQVDRNLIREAVAMAKQAVLYEPRDYLSDIDYLLHQIDFNKNKEGVGIFVSSKVRKLVQFPFAVTKRVVVNRFFHLQDLLYVENYSKVYYLLDISKKEIHLFRGVMDHLEEINDDHFPWKNDELYEYNKPSQSSSDAGYAHVKSFEKDKSEVEHMRLKKIFREADKCLSEYLTGKTLLILCGPERNISLYKFVTKHEANIITSIGDNYRRAHLHDLELLAWLQVRSYIDNEKSNLIDEFKEKIGVGLATYGVKEVLKAAREGKGYKLLLEKDYRSGTIVGPEKKLVDYEVVKYGKYPDVINEIVTTVLEKNGKVTVLERDALKGYNRIALINRY